MKTTAKHSWIPVTLAAIAALTTVSTPARAAGLKAATVTCSEASVTAGDTPFTACAGAFEGNDTGQGNPLLTALNGGLFDGYVNAGIWSLLGKSDEGQFLADQGASTGTWNLLDNEILNGSFVISLKAGNTFSAFLFTDAVNVNRGTFTTMGVSTNKQGKAQDLSHASIFALKHADEEIIELNEPSLSGGGLFILMAGAPLTLAMAKPKQS